MQEAETLEKPVEESQPPVAVEETPEIKDNEVVYAVFDTETTGLFKFRDAEGNPVPADHPDQPRLASVAFILANQDGIEISREKLFVQPDGWSMPQGFTDDGKPTAGEVNGLTDEFLAENGIPVAEVLDLWEGYVEAGYIAVAYNSQFDCKMMRAELRRAGRPDNFEQTPNTCVMRGQKPYIDQGMFPTKRWNQKLTVACQVHGIPLTNAHDAMADTEAARALLEILIRDGNVIEPKVHYAAKPPVKANAAAQ